MLQPGFSRPPLSRWSEIPATATGRGQSLRLDPAGRSRPPVRPTALPHPLAPDLERLAAEIAAGEGAVERLAAVLSQLPAAAVLIRPPPGRLLARSIRTGLSR